MMICFAVRSDKMSDISMQTSIGVGGYVNGEIEKNVRFVQAAESAGVTSVWSAEAWGQDAVTSLAYLAAVTSRIKLGTGIMQISARAPAMTAMTAMSLNALSKGRFMLGLGASGPQVVEGLHGVAYHGPLTRLKETIDICRIAFRGEKIRYDGKHHVLPRTGGEGKAITSARVEPSMPDIHSLGWDGGQWYWPHCVLLRAQHFHAFSRFAYRRPDESFRISVGLGSFHESRRSNLCQ